MSDTKDKWPGANDDGHIELTHVENWGIFLPSKVNNKRKRKCIAHRCDLENISVSERTKELGIGNGRGIETWGAVCRYDDKKGWHCIFCLERTPDDVAFLGELYGVLR